MPESAKLRYDKLGPAAILLSAYRETFAAVTVAEPVDDAGVACVEVCGPLTQRAGQGFDSYESVLARVRAALATPARVVLLRIGSPGGDVYGCFETARAVRAAADASGKRLVAYVDGQAASAAYALACAADEIVLPASACVGSIGCVDMLASVARQDAAMGIDFAVVTSGARKADGNPHVPISEGALAAHQGHIDELEAVFFAWVAERRGISVEDVKGFEAALFIGEKAVAAKLADRVQDFYDLRGTLTATAPTVPQGIQMTTPKASKYTDAMAALAALAEEGDEDAKKAMKKMLSPAKAAEDTGEKDEPKKDESKAEASDDEKKDKDAAGAKALAQANVDALAEVIKLRNEIAARDERDQRRKLLASRPDLTADAKTKAMLERMPLDTLREAVESLPKATLPGVPEVKPTQGARQNVGQPEAQARDLRIEMGLESVPRASVTKTDNMTIFGGTPAQIAERLGEGK